MLVGVLALSIPQSGAATTTTQENSPLSTAIGLLLMLPLGWWAFARVTGYLWNMNGGLSWKLMMCTGALALTLSAVAYDLVVKAIVNRLYTGGEDAKYMILPADAEEPSGGTQVKGQNA
jgi:hypothetical protein